MRFLLPPLLLVAAITIISATYVVREDEQVIITQFGEPVGDPISTPGLKFKLPFIQQVQVFDKRFLEWQGDAEELTTKDKVYIFVDVYARWRIADPLLFFQRLKDERIAQSRLDDILDGETRNAIARHNLLQLIRTSNRVPSVDELSTEDETRWEEIGDGRTVIRKQILQASKAAAEQLGIEIEDVRFRRINYSEKVEPSVFARMISERQRVAARYRSEGQGEQARILGEMERELKRIESEAYRDAERIRGTADAEATSIYAAAYNQDAESREFYEFTKTMETFEQTIGEDTWLLLSTDGDFYRYLKGSGL